MNHNDVTDIARRVKEASEPNLQWIAYNACKILSEVCESPIEIMLGATVVLCANIDAVIGLPPTMAISCTPNERQKHTFTLYPQFHWKSYRIDFAIRIRGARQSLVFIECDGHSFHERTKEQAARDRKKDREIQQAGIPILRFTGSEIFRDVGDAALQILQFLNKHICREEDCE